MHQIKYLIADWRTQGMISNRISMQQKDLFTLLNKKRGVKYRWKRSTSILTVKVRPDHRMVGDTKRNDGKQRDFAIQTRGPWKSFPTLMILWFLWCINSGQPWKTQMRFLTCWCLCPTFFCLCRFSPHSYVGICSQCRGSQVSCFPPCLHECLAVFARC